MGMFDEIKYECKEISLPVIDKILEWNIDVNSITYQTKDLENLLNLYTVNGEGRLIYKNVKYKWKDDDNAFLKGYMEEESHTLDDMNYHGVLNFYTYENLDKDGKQFSYSLDYEAKFTDGKLTSIKLKEFTIEDTTDRREGLRKLFKDHEISKNKWYNKYFLQTKVYRKYIKNPIVKTLYFFNTFSSKMYSFALRYL